MRAPPTPAFAHTRVALLVAQTFKADGKLGKDKFQGSLQAAFSHNNLEFKDVKIDTASKVGGKMNLKDVADGLDLTFAAEDGLVTANSASAKFGIAYKNADFGTFNAAVNVIEGPVVTADTLINYQGFLVGGEAELNTGIRGAGDMSWTKYNVGLGYDGADFRVGVTSCVAVPCRSWCAAAARVHAPCSCP